MKLDAVDLDFRANLDARLRKPMKPLTHPEVLGKLLPDETVTSAGAHEWRRDERPGAVSWPFCQRCGIVQRHDGKNKPCPGTVHVSPRGQEPQKDKR